MKEMNKVAFIGAGSMAVSIISGLLRNNRLRPDQIFVTNKNKVERLEYLSQRYGIQTTQNKQVVMNNADIVLLAMKPKDVADGIQSIKPFVQKKQLIISVLAGITTDFISHLLESDVPVIRTMPNTSSSIGCSATTLAAGQSASPGHLDVASFLFEAIGTATIVNEEELHITTSIAGSGPAYFYYIVEAMQEAAKELGLGEQLSRELLAQTLHGASQMLMQTDTDVSALRKNVVSPGGTTEAGLEKLELHRVQEAFVDCVKNAAKRSEELGNLFSSISK
jgi:pyrroline-5-carboxylate reductase